MYRTLGIIVLSLIISTTQVFGSNLTAEAQQLVKKSASKKITDFSDEELKVGLAELKSQLFLLNDALIGAQAQADGSFLLKVESVVANKYTGLGVTLLGSLVLPVLATMATNGGDIRMRAYIISAGGAFILWAILSGAVKGAVALSTVELNQLKSTIKDLNVQIARIEMKIQRNEMNRAAQN
jgi:hypothetical protein